MATESTGFFAIIGKIAEAISSLFTYLHGKAERQYSQQKEKNQKISEKNKRLDDICDNGNLNDLLEEMENK